MFELEIEPASVTILLLDAQNQTHNFEQNTVDINCESTPIEVGVLTDLSKPVFYTRGKCIILAPETPRMCFCFRLLLY